jgi:Uma2 family endonuclease
MKTDRSGGSPSSLYKTKTNVHTFQEIDDEDDNEIEIDYDQLITEDDEPVDNIFSERQQHMFIDSIYSSWKIDRSFVALANVGIYERIPTTPMVPDALLSLDVKLPKDIWKKKNRCYMIGVYKKPPELVVEVVSNKVGGEKEKKHKYARMGIKYYVIYDPDCHIYKRKLHAFELKGHSYDRLTSNNSKCWLEDIGLGLIIKEGTYDLWYDAYLRWYDKSGEILNTGQENAFFELKRKEKIEKKAEKQKQRAEKEKKRAEKEKKRAESEKQRADQAEKELLRLKKLLAAQRQ